MTRVQFKRILMQWHRRLGISSAAMVVLLCITGILLNHSDDWHLGQKPIRASWLLSLYGIETPTLLAYTLGNTRAEQIGQQLSINGTPVATCDGILVGSEQIADFYIFACTNELLLTTLEGILVERVSAVYGLPVPILTMTTCQQKICLNTPNGAFSTTAELTAFTKTQETFTAPTQAKIPADIQETLLASYAGNDITWARLIQDIHAGRFFGRLGPGLMDVFALSFFLLAASGIALWWRNTQRRRND